MADETTKEDPKLGSVPKPQDGSTDKPLDTPNADLSPAAELNKPASEAPHDSKDPVPDQDMQEASNPDASHKPGEAMGAQKVEQKAAEQAPDTADKTNPVSEATDRESKDPYAEGKHIANPEPNNGLGDTPEAGKEMSKK